MINTTGRLLDYWLPPEGAGKPIAALATTFTFDADFFDTECLSRFLGLDTARGETSDLAFLINQEERLAEARVSVLVDRNHSSESRSLRWDLVPIGVRTGVMHAKVMVLAWDRLVRFVVTSANLTESSYRSNTEMACAVDAFDGSDIPRALSMELMGALRSIANLAPGSRDQPGPKARALATLAQVSQQLDTYRLATRLPGRMRASVVVSGLGEPALPQLARVWQGGPARQATVLSPYFDDGESESGAVHALTDQLAQRGLVSVTFAVQAEDQGTVIRIPQLVRRSLPTRVNAEFRPLLKPDPNETRRLHAKAVVLSTESWTAALVGSSNFTAPGLGVPGGGNLEVNLALGVPGQTAESRALQGLFRMGDPLDVTDVSWEPDQDETQGGPTPLPWGFVQCLLHPGHPSTLILHLSHGELPETWHIQHPTAGTCLLTSAEWEGQGHPAEIDVVLPESQPTPFFVDVEWAESSGGIRRSGWAVNVTELALLPPPEELRHLPMWALIQALASTRPLHEALSAAVQGPTRPPGLSQEEQLDALKRHKATGQFLQRARQVSAALEGLRQRLSRPASSLDTLEWRLNGPFGPRAIAEGTLAELGQQQGFPGEAQFLLAELALTIAGVDWERALIGLPEEQARQAVTRTLRHIQSMASGIEVDAAPDLARYMAEALAEAQR